MTSSVEHEKDGPPRKTMRLLEPDLTIVLHYEDEEGNVAEKAYHEWSFRLAEWSDFFKAALSNRMKEKVTQTFALPETTPDTWEAAMGFLKSPIEARNMTPVDVVDVAEFYHKYQFMMGLELCDTVLVDYINSQSAKPAPTQLELLVTCISLACQCGMKESKRSGVNFVETRLQQKNLPTGRLMFTIEHMEDLHALFKEGLISDEAVPQEIRTEIHCPSFPAKFVLHSLKGFVPAFHIKTGGRQHWYGKVFCMDREGEAFHSTETSRNSFMEAVVERSYKYGRDWCLVERRPVRRIVMTCPGSRCLPYPPNQGWKILDPDLGVEAPVFTYINEHQW